MLDFVMAVIFFVCLCDGCDFFCLLLFLKKLQKKAGT